MTKEQIVTFLGFFSATSVTPTSEWVRCSCPLAPWTHDSGADSSPSFGIKVEDNGDSYFNCYACEHGDLWDLLGSLSGFGAKAPKYQIKSAVAFLSDIELGQDSVQLMIDDYGVKPPPKLHAYSEGWLSTFLPASKSARALGYLESRGFPGSVADEYELKYDTSRDAVSFPIRGADGALLGMRGRRINPTGTAPRYHLYNNQHNEKNSRIWYGIDRVDYNYPVIIVESVFDRVATEQVFMNVIAPLSTGLSKRQVELLGGVYDVVTFFDHGMGGDKARKTIAKYLPSATIIDVIPPVGRDPGDMTPDEIRESLSECIGLLRRPKGGEVLPQN